MEWLAAAIALVAAASAFWQASEARAARKDARLAAAAASADAATAAAALSEIASNSERSASATEGIGASSTRSAAALEALAAAPPPWRLERTSTNSDTWKLINDSTRNVVTKKVTGLTSRDAEWFGAQGWTPNVEKSWYAGDWEVVSHRGSGMIAAPYSITVLVTWRWEQEPATQSDRMWKGTMP